MKEIFVTGATGFVGRELVSELNGKYKLTCLVRKSSNAKFLEKIDALIVKGDLENKETFKSYLKNRGIVIHLATSHNSKKNSSDIEISKNIIDSCKKKKIEKIIFISSMAVKRKSLDEYGNIKLRIEELIKESGINFTIIRPSIIYSKNNLSLIEKSLKIFPLIIPVIGNGEYKINPVYLGDVVNAIKLSLENKKTANKEYDIAGKEALSFNNIIEICKKHFNIKKKVIHFPINICLFLFKIFPVISLEAVKGINEDTNADNTLIKKDLKINLIEFEKGIKNVNI